MYDEIIKKINTGKFFDAEKDLDVLILKNPNDSKSLYLNGVVKLKLNKLEESLENLSNSVKYDKNIENLFAYAEVLTKIKKFTEAEDCYKKILLLDNLNEPALINLGYIYLLTEQYIQSEDCYLKAIKINKKNYHYFLNLGNLYKRQNMLTKAISEYNQALKLNPLNHDIKKALGTTLLTQKKYDIAWDYFESRIYARQNKGLLFDTIKNYIFKEHEIIKAKNLVVVSEQGIGDKILFSSIYKDLLKKNINIKFITEKRLIAIFRRSFGDFEYILDNNISRIKELIQMDFKFIYAGSLGKYFRKKISNFDGNSFLKPNNKKILEYQSVLKNYKFKKYIGISWKSSSEFRGKKSYNINDFKPILSNESIGVVNLQYGEVEDLNRYNLENEKKIIQIKNLDLLNEIDNVISLISCLDYIITSPNVTIHLAGCVGKNCIAYYHSNYESILNSSTNISNEWYNNLKIIQFNEDLKSKVKQTLNIIN